MENDKLLSIEEAAEYLGVRPQTLYNWRSLSKGPDYVRIGRLKKYRRTSLDTFADENTVRLSR